MTFHVLNQRNPGRIVTTPKVRKTSSEMRKGMAYPAVREAEQQNGLMDSGPEAVFLAERVCS